jgi:cytochrome c-type biogenesis protein CcmF
MIADIGLFALAISFGLAVYATGASAYGGRWNRPTWVESARNASLLVFPLLTISVIALLYSLYVMDFSLSYVNDVASRSMSPFLRLVALWGGQQGSMLFWAWIMAGFVMAVLLRKWERDYELMPYVIAVSMITTTFFIGVVVFITNPFTHLWHFPGAAELTTSLFQPAGAMAYIPEDGSGLNPLLRHFGMIGHPPTTYLGFTGFVIPFAFAIAALITGKSRGDDWIHTTRRWTLFAWIFLSIGLILGGRWAYDVLGWGGFWGWDPIENAMLMPWLTGTAFLHSVMMTEKRGMLKKWNMVMIILTYSLSLFGTFLTRTGVVSSVHAFSKSALGPAFFVFIGLTFLGSLHLLVTRWDTLKSEHELESFFSREAAFLLQNLLLLGITFAVLWGTVFPMISELITGTKITVGPPYFKKVTGPLFGVLVLLMGIAPLFAWRKQSARKLGKAMLIPFVASLVIAIIWGYAHRMHPGSYVGLWLVTFVVLAILLEFWKGISARVKNRRESPFTALRKLIGRNHRRYGGYIIHLGVVMIALGFIGDSYFKEETQGTVSIGETLQLGKYTLRFDNLDFYTGSDGREILEASTTLFRDGELVRELKPRRDYFVVQQQPVTIPGVYSTPGADVYVLLVGWEELGLQASTFKIYLNPLINWTWSGGIVMILGTLIAAWVPTGGKQGASYLLKQRPAHFDYATRGG